jgi:hypothetical protein
MPVPPYTITFQPSSSGTALVSRVIVSCPSGASGVHEGPMVPVLQIYQSLGGTRQDIFSKGKHRLPRATIAPPPGTTNTPVHLTIYPPQVTLVRDAQVAPLQQRLAQKTRRRILSDRLNPHHSPKTHAKISPVLLSGLPSSRHYMPYTYTPLTHWHHITDIMRVRVKAVICNMRASSLTAG